MNKVIAATLMSASIVSFSTVAQAEGWDLFAGKSEGYTTEATVALVGGSFMPVADGAESSTLYGVEVSMNCPLLQPPSNRIRQQASVTQSDENGTSVLGVEINPHYVVELSEGFEVGFGPGFGLLMVDSGAVNKTLFGAQVGVSAHYRMGSIFVGGEGRYQLTTEQDFGAGKVDMNNNRVLLKIGMDL